jgi:triosephosphate isomerase
MPSRHYVSMNTPAVVVNVKTYRKGTGGHAVSLARTMQQVHEDNGAALAIAVQTSDLYRVAQAVDIPVFAQHMDAIGYGSHTGWTLPEALVAAGADGVLLNHSEHRLRADVVAAAVRRAGELGLDTVVCADSPDVAGAMAALHPGFVAIEPPELIGGDVSVTSADPDIVKQSVARVQQVAPEVQVLCGAGVKTAGDISAALDLGAVGVLLASGVVKADEPETVLRELAGAVV